MLHLFFLSTPEPQATCCFIYLLAWIAFTGVEKWLSKIRSFLWLSVYVYFLSGCCPEYKLAKYLPMSSSTFLPCTLCFIGTFNHHISSLFPFFISMQCCLLTTGFGNTVNACTLLTITQVFQYATWGKNSFDGTFIFHISDCLLWKTSSPWWAYILPLLFDYKPLKLQVRSLIWKQMPFEEEFSLHFLYAPAWSGFLNDTLQK